MTRDYLLRELSIVNSKIDAIKNKLEKYPEGKLTCAKNGNGYKWYRSFGKHRVYLPKKDRSLAEVLALKAYLTVLLDELNSEKHALDLCLKTYTSDEKASDKLFSEGSGYRELLTPHFKPLTSELEEWANADYPKNEAYPEHLNNKTISGKYVRSKSEVLIDTILYQYKIPYRYECALELNSHTIYPDFTIRHPTTGEIYYWENYGLMDDKSYIRNVTSKHNQYISNGIIPTINLITTYETAAHPLDIDMVEKIVKHYFL